MNINHISEESHNQAMLTLNAERQELLYYKKQVEELLAKQQEIIEQAEERRAELFRAFDEKVTEVDELEERLECESMAYDSERLANENLHEDIRIKDIEIRQLRAKLGESPTVPGIVHYETNTTEPDNGDNTANI